ncbi:MAG: hypothetical protein M0T70_13345 [Geobacteraceae bacterium]|nr:hypothetical protein [Geobacteraceae bacterium]
MNTARRTLKKKPLKKAAKSNKVPMLSVVTVRISDEEKERIDAIMKQLRITRYSDVMRLALQMVKQQQSA